MLLTGCLPNVAASYVPPSKSVQSQHRNFSLQSSHLYVSSDPIKQSPSLFVYRSGLLSTGSDARWLRMKLANDLKKEVCSRPANKTPPKRHLPKTRHVPGDQLDRHQFRSHSIRSVSGELAHTRDRCCFESHQHINTARGKPNSETKSRIEVNKQEEMFTPSKKTHPEMCL
jgi:hypothetical protein